MTIKCPKCDFENSDDTLFCGKCGTQLPFPEKVEVTETIETPKEELTTGSTKMINQLIHEIKSRWIAILSWGFGLILFGVIYISIFDGMYEQMTVFRDLSIYKAVGMQLGSVEGYIAFAVLAYISVLVGIYCIVTSTSTLAGEEDNGTLELIVAMPLGRWQRGKITD